jgi:hypothetical protein|tara:strand:+ start:515 stop:1081 length:567 start_codon:yes stop_codon:yes gene_type:complete
MTPRLKKLLVGFAISLVILVSDRMSQNSDSRSDRTEQKEEKKQRRRPRTARIDAERMKRVAEDAQWLRDQKSKKIIQPSQDFKPIPEKVLALSDWGRNPFSGSDLVPVTQVVNQSIQSTATPEPLKVSPMMALRIESVATLGDKTFVIINGQRFQEGDNIDDMIIETINSKNITFKKGRKKIIKNVGT